MASELTVFKDHHFFKIIMAALECYKSTVISSNVIVSILDGVLFQGCQRQFSLNRYSLNESVYFL